MELVHKNILSSVALLFFLVLTLPQNSRIRAQNPQQDYLNAHNAARSEVGVGAMTWDDNVAAYAKAYVSQRAGDCSMVHSNGPYGENLAEGSELTGQAAVEMWVGEKSYYDHSSNSCVGGECRHYTQVVWRDSVRLGCARAQCSNGGWFVSCNYDPPGNVADRSPY